jgi:tartrate dehydratase beta subunit/fumarate hydratase class I family protein
MGEAFDRTCRSLRIIGDTVTVREIIAKRIIDAANNGERDPARLYEQVLKAYGIDDTRCCLLA